MKKLPFLIFAASTLMWGCSSDSKTKDFGVDLKLKVTPEGFYEETIPYNLFIERFQQNLDNEIILSNGKKITSNKEGIIYINTWNDLFMDALLKPELKYLGLEVSNHEMEDMIFGNNINIALKDMKFLKDASGKYQPKVARDFIHRIENDTAYAPRLTWEVFLRKIKYDHQIAKYRGVLENVCFITPVEDAFYKKHHTRQIDFDYAFKSYATIDIHIPHDSLVYNLYKEYKESYYKPEYRKVSYVTAKPDIDSANHVEELKRFNALTHHLDSDFKSLASKNPNIKHLITEYELSTVRGQLKPFFEKGEINESYGPYYASGSYRITKIVDRYDIPDSVEVQHILLNNNDTIHTVKIINTIIENDNFEEMVDRYSVDKRKLENRGNFGWIKYDEIIEPLNSASFAAPEGILFIAESKYGRHILRVLNKAETSKTMILADGLFMDLQPNDNDFRTLEKKVEKMISQSNSSDELFANAIQYGFATQNITLLNTNYVVPDIDKSTRMVKWCFTHNENSISKPFKLNDQLYVFSVSEIIPTGIMPFSEVSDIVRSDFKTLTKKDTLDNKLRPLLIKNGTIKENANILNSEIMSIKGLKLSSYDVPNMGLETKLKGIVAALKIGETSDLFQGDKGLYIVKKTNEYKTPLTISPKEKITRQYLAAVSNDHYLLDIIKKTKTHMNIVREENSYMYLKDYTEILPSDSLLSVKMLDAEYAFRNKEFKIALKGTNQFQGFESLLNENSNNTKQNRLLKIYASICYMQLEQYDTALSLLKSIPTMEDFMFSAIIPMLIADNYTFLNNVDKAIEYYRKAADNDNSIFYNGIVLHKLMLCHMNIGQYAKAIETGEELLFKNNTHYNGQITMELIAMLQILNKE
ncbi:MAG: peptidylprolyl isomerase [Salinivirgaceae bacterium]|nr:peptidylprolyl isomerase [Salinivirgaceae bacterium]MDD4747285.1 peptidylprolyl isomerase [Salinivirgaceae bacterium]MDY0280183.1 peptidylprolyl isomerase [Salinivirgaceae bacterium]